MLLPKPAGGGMPNQARWGKQDKSSLMSALSVLFFIALNVQEQNIDCDDKDMKVSRRNRHTSYSSDWKPRWLYLTGICH